MKFSVDKKIMVGRKDLTSMEAFAKILEILNPFLSTLNYVDYVI